MADSKRSRGVVFVDYLAFDVNGGTKYIGVDKHGDHFPITESEYTGDRNTGVSRREKRENAGDLSITINADVGDAITGFKALQRELRKTTKEARELESAYEDLAKKMGEGTADSARLSAKSLERLASASTKELHEELAKREGVEEYTVLPHGDIAALTVNNDVAGSYDVTIDGPARILVNKD